MEFRRVLSDGQHLVGSLLFKRHVGCFTRCNGEDIKIVWVTRLLLPKRYKGVAGALVLMGEEVAQTQKIPGLERLRRELQACGKGFDRGGVVLLPVVRKPYIQGNSRLMGRQRLGRAQFN